MMSAGPYQTLSPRQSSSLSANVSHWCGMTPYHQNDTKNAHTAATIASPQVSGAGSGRRRLAMT